MNVIFQSTFPLQGTTGNVMGTADYVRNFNPRSHCRERPFIFFNNNDEGTFQSTFPLQGTTSGGSINRPALQHFNPRSHCRERLIPLPPNALYASFQSTFPLQGTTKSPLIITILFFISIHVPIAGNDSKLIQFLIYNCKIFVLYYSYL